MPDTQLKDGNLVFDTVFSIEKRLAEAVAGSGVKDSFKRQQIFMRDYSYETIHTELFHFIRKMEEKIAIMPRLQEIIRIRRRSLLRN